MEAEFESIENKRSWQHVFLMIKMNLLQDVYTMKEAKKAENRSLNRYRDVHPYDHSRVILKRSDVDYINANLVPVEKAGREYILTQGPLIETLSHFWLMIWEKHTKGIVMLNKLVEKNVLKCHKYWPDKESLEMELESVGLTVSFISESAKYSYICRTFRLDDAASGESREVFQFQYMNWPDFGVPQSPDDFLDFLEDVRRSGSLESDVGPAVVHCSAGIGRSGTFCLVDSILRMIQHKHIAESEINLQEILLDMRRYRMCLVQAAEQLRFSYLAIIEALRRQSGQSPYLSRKKDEDAPPPPPHRARPSAAIVTHAEDSFTDGDGNNDADNRHDIDVDDENPVLGNGGAFREAVQKAARPHDTSVLPTETSFKESPADSACVSSDASGDESNSESDSDSGTGPPPLPPKDIPTGELLDSQQLLQQPQEQLPTPPPPQQQQQQPPPPQHQLPINKVLSNLSDDLHSFEKEILANECMQNKPELKQDETAPTSTLNTNPTPRPKLDADEEMLIRKRQQDQKIIQKVQAIKKGVKDAEAAHERRSLFENIGIGVVVFLGAGVLLYRFIDYVRG